MKKIFENVIVGIDEAAKGCAVGSMFIVGVLPTNEKFYDLPLKDSKKLTKEKRAELAFKIKQYSKVKIVKISNYYIDKFGISYGYKKALREIVNFFDAYCAITDKECIYFFDGNTNFGINEINTVIKGDSKIKEIMAASIIAKNKKDKEMERLDRLTLNKYNWIKNNGYLTKEHKERIKQYGISEFHRKTFKLI